MDISIGRALLIVTAMSVSQACVDSATGDEELTSSEAQAILTGPPGTWQETLLEPRREDWYFYDRGAISGTDWRSDFYCGGCDAWGFGIGPAPLGYGETYLSSIVDYGGDPAHKHVTTYFKTPFYARHTVRALYLRVMYDDGFVYYLNGHQGGSASMPSGTITPSTLALGHEAENRYVTFDISAQIPHLSQSNLNWLAFEVHQAAASSSDLVFDAQLIAWVDGPLDVTAHEGIPRGDYWHFWDRSGVPSTWKAPSLDDSNWSAGEGALGFGETYLKTETRPGGITTYFRKQFVIDGSVHGLTADVMYDDGFVAYLNGSEIGRASMPSGTVGGSTLALDHEAGNVYRSFNWDAAVPLLVDGENVLAIEVHQNSATSSDMVFDLGLRVEGAWSPQSSGTDSWLGDIRFLDASRGWAVGQNGTIRRTVDGGATWTGQPSGATQDLLAIDFADAQHGWIVGRGGTILHTTDGGNTWTAQSAGVTGDIFDVSFPSPTHGWVVVAGDIYATTDGGATWAQQQIATDQVRDIDFADASNGWATVGVDGVDEEGIGLFHTVDGGATWTGAGPFFSTLGSITDVEVVDANTIWVIHSPHHHDDSGEAKLVSRDGGVTWVNVPATDNNMSLSDIMFLDAMHGWAVGAGGSFIATRDGGYTWEVQQVPTLVEGADRIIGDGPSYSAIYFCSLDHGWAVGGNTILHTSTGGW